MFFGIGEWAVIFIAYFYIGIKYLGLTWALIPIFVVIGALSIHSKWKLMLWKRKGVPGPPPTLFVGHLLQIFSKGFHVSDAEWSKKYGKAYGAYLGHQPELVITDLEQIKQVLVKDFQYFTNRRDFGPDAANSDTIFAKAITVLTDEHWKNVRNTMTPAFTSGKMRHMSAQVHRCLDTLSEILKEKAERGEPVLVKDHFGAFAMDLIAAVAFGTEIDSQRNPQNSFVKYAKELSELRLKNWRVIFSILFPKVVFYLGKWFKIRVFFSDGENFFRKILAQMIEERRLHPLEKPDFLQLMLNASEGSEKEEKKSGGPADAANTSEEAGREARTDGLDVWAPTGKRVKLPDIEIIAQSFIFLAAGYDTTATTMMFCAYSLAINPEVQEKLYQELKEALGSEPVTYEQANHRLPYLEAVLLETLRMYPPAVRFDRNCSADYQLGDINIPKGAAVVVPAYTIHHSPEHYPDPEKFDPERFLPEAKAERNPLTFLPFGYGPRNCIGMRFALMEIKMTFAEVLRRFKFVPCDKTQRPIKVHSENLLKPTDPVWLGVELRRD